jgi:hypothetical protein
MRTPSTLAAVSVWLLGTSAFDATGRADELKQAPKYTVRFIAPVPAVRAMNNAAVAVGWTTDDRDAVRAWVWSENSGFMLLPLPEGTDSSLPEGIADSGVIAGSAQLGLLGDPVPTIWIPDGDGGYGVQTLAELPGHSGGVATAVNDIGDVIGYSILPGWAGGPATLFSSSSAGDDVPVNLQALGFEAAPRDVNDARQICGGRFRMDLDTGVVEEFEQPQVPGFEKNYFASADLYTINESAQVAGRGLLTTSSDINQHAIRFTDGDGWEIIDFVPTTENIGVGINEHGDVAIRNQPLAFFDGVGPAELNDIIDDSLPENAGWSFGFTYGFPDINNARQILTVAVNVNTQQSGAVLLTPMRPSVPGDFNGDGVVGPDDLAELLAQWGECGKGDSCTADIAPPPPDGGDGIVGPADLAQLLANWG